MSNILLAELLTPDRIRIPIQASDKHGVIGELSEFMADMAGLEPAEGAAIGDAVLEREAVLTTGIGGGVAIPHGKVEALDDLQMVAGLTSTPVEFESLDGQPVRIVLLLVGPDSASGKHVRALS
ncbi:MAG: PTS sugar transporter subunit IIA, partial [Gemmatimonadota bacterium]|nr:PTS sugar transporter subunit IIA [Gemmatimonadota bacterium]